MFHILYSLSDGQILYWVQSECQRNHRLGFYCFQSLQSISLLFLSSVILLSAYILEWR